MGIAIVLAVCMIFVVLYLRHPGAPGGINSVSDSDLSDGLGSIGDEDLEDLEEAEADQAILDGVFSEGRQAYLDNIPVICNPYGHSKLAQCWKHGWYSAKNDVGLDHYNRHLL